MTVGSVGAYRSSGHLFYICRSNYLVSHLIYCLFYSILRFLYQNVIKKYSLDILWITNEIMNRNSVSNKLYWNRKCNASVPRRPASNGRWRRQAGHGTRRRRDGRHGRRFSGSSRFDCLRPDEVHVIFDPKLMRWRNWEDTKLIEANIYINILKDRTISHSFSFSLSLSFFFFSLSFSLTLSISLSLLWQTM